MRRIAFGVLAFVLVGAAAFWILTGPKRLDAGAVAALSGGDLHRGERIFNAGGCVSCHSRPGSGAATRLQLAGGVRLSTPFGVFVAPNISQHPDDGIGGWSLEDFANALTRGVSPEGRHYYPAFPYSSYARMRPADVADLYAYLKTLPAVAGKAPPSDVRFPFSVRRGIGLWKLLHLSPDPVVALAPDAAPALLEGRNLVEGPGHCGECHTPRDVTGGVVKAHWLAGGPALGGKGWVPNITSGKGGIADWSEGDIAEMLKTGFTPDFDSVGGDMAEVVRNTALLSDADRAAMAAYLKAVPPQDSAAPRTKPAGEAGGSKADTP